MRKTKISKGLVIAGVAVVTVLAIILLGFFSNWSLYKDNLKNDLEGFDKNNLDAYVESIVSLEDAISKSPLAIYGSVIKENVHSSPIRGHQNKKTTIKVEKVLKGETTEKEIEISYSSMYLTPNKTLEDPYGGVIYTPDLEANDKVLILGSLNEKDFTLTNEFNGLYYEDKDNGEFTNAACSNSVEANVMLDFFKALK